MDAYAQLSCVKDKVKSEVAGRMRRAWSASGKSMSEVAKISGIPASTLRGYLKGETAPDIASLLMFAGAVKCDPDELTQDIGRIVGRQ